MPTPVTITRSLSWPVYVRVVISRTTVFGVQFGNSVRIDRKLIWTVTGLQISLNSSIAQQVRTSPVQSPPVNPWMPPPSVPALSNPFDRVYVDYLTLGATRVTWDLNPHFLQPGNYTFQLQVSETDNPSANDWSNIGPTLVNTYTTTDSITQQYGKLRTTGYRVALTLASGQVFYSMTANTLGDLVWREWQQAKEIIRKESLRHRWQVSPATYLFKRRRFGAPCTRCLDITGSSTDSKCPVCYGTSKQGGYFPALKASFVDVTQESRQERRSTQGTGMANQGIIKGRFVGWPMPASQDVVVNVSADLRYVIDEIEITSQMRGVPLVITASLRKLPPEDVAYTLDPNKVS